MYMYLPRYIRKLGLIAIFMETNAKKANFINMSQAYDSREDVMKEEIDINHGAL